MAAYQYAYRMICVILWKSWRSRKHRLWQTSLQVLAPVMLVLLLVSVKGVMEQNGMDEDAERKMDRPITFPQKDIKSLLEGLCQVDCKNVKLNVSRTVPLLAYAPNNTATEAIMDGVQQILLDHGGLNIDVQGFETELEIEAVGAFLRANSSGWETEFRKKTYLIGAVIFLSDGYFPNDLVYKIRLISSKFETGKFFPNIETPGPGRQFKHYENSGFLGLQMAIDDAFLTHVNWAKLSGVSKEGLKAGEMKVETAAFPHPPYAFKSVSHYTTVLAVLLPSSIIIGFACMASITIAILVDERNNGVQEFFTMLGLNRFGYWLGWMINVYIFQLISVALIVVILTTNVSGDGAVLHYSAKSVLWVFLVLYLYAAVWFCFFVSTLLSSSKYSHSLGVIIWLGTFVVPAILVGSKQRFLATQLLVAVIPNMCLYWGFEILATWESKAIGIHWNNIEEYPSSSISLNLASMLAMLVFDSIFFMVLTLFVKHWQKKGKKRTLKDPYHMIMDVLVDPDKKFPDFPHPLQKTCKFLSKKKSSRKSSLLNDLGMDDDPESPMGILRTKVLAKLGLLVTEEIPELQQRGSLLEPESPTKDCGVKVRNLSKNYQADSVLKSVSCDFYTGEIACICGGNGSGKTTLLQILNGMTPADDGTAYIHHYDIHDYLTLVRSCIGVCSQEDILFGDLSVMEHLLLFAWLKGKDWSSARQDALHVLSALKMKDKKKVRAHKLMASDKRKLSFGISIMGDPKVIILDEPTARMDHESAKLVQNLLVKLKVGKTIVMSTKSLEEADLVADRVAVLNDGHLRCYGSPEYLREAFGNGYTLKLRVHTKNAEKLVRMITQEIKYAEVKHRTMSVGGEELVFVLPELYAPHFPKIFDQFYTKREAMGIMSVDVHRTSVEEIYYRVHELRDFAKKESMHNEDEHHKKSETSPFFVGEKLVGVRLGFSRFAALMRKNYWMTKSNKLTILLQFFVPLVFILCGLTGANRGLRNRDTEHYTELAHSLHNYETAYSLYHIDDDDFRRRYLTVVGDHARPAYRDYKASTTALEIAKTDLAAYRHDYLVGVDQVTMPNKSTVLVALYSTIAFNAPPLSINLVSNARFNMIKSVRDKRKIRVENHPMENGTENLMEALLESGTNVLAKSFCFYFPYALAILSAAVAIKPMVERVCGSHHIQAMTGVNPILFWLSYGIVDTLFLILFVAIAVFSTLVVQEKYIFTMYGGAEILFLILLLGGFAASKFAYFFSQMVDNSILAFASLNLLHLLAVLGSFVVYQSNDGVQDFFSETYYWLSTPFPVPFMVHAFYVYSRVVMDNSQCELASTNTLNLICSKPVGSHMYYSYLPEYSCCANCGFGKCFMAKSFYTTSYGIEGYTITRDLCVLAVSALSYYVLVILVDYHLFRRLSQYFLGAPSEAFEHTKLEKDPSACEEAELVTKLIGLGTELPAEEGLLVDGLCKNYGTTAPYSNVSFAVKRGECFGLLGLSGAGKTCVFKTLIGLEYPAVGDAFLNPYSLVRSSRNLCSSCGYCPQENSLLTDLTGRQMLNLQGGLKGICAKDLDTEVNQWLSLLGLENDADRRCGEYSRGMKRRLSIAIALIGNPSLIILDDPSREIDSSGKRHLWSILHRLRNDNKIILIASPNVQECETLCGRLGLMINGKLQYVGTTAEIKRKFLNGFTVIFKLKTHYTVDDAGDLEVIGDIKANVEAILQDGVFREAHLNTLKYLIPHQDQNWGSILEKLEKIRTSMSDSIEYYSMMESSLDEVFAAMMELDSESTNELDGVHITCCQRFLMGECCADDYS